MYTRQREREKERERDRTLRERDTGHNGRRLGRWNDRYPAEYYFLDEVGERDEEAGETEKAPGQETMEKMIDAVDSIFLLCVMVSSVGNYLESDSDATIPKEDRAALFTEATRKACMYYTPHLATPLLKFIKMYYSTANPPLVSLDHVASKLIEKIITDLPLRTSADPDTEDACLIRAVMSGLETNSLAIKEFLRRETFIEKEEGGGQARGRAVILEE
eukprot:TRINITY_DN15678_c0_g2_i1.p1 TRINITY_DN15678_c0_g2~~TRINITY_DN15678_c0_g2_i1.p1  ORF type:complete len:218 (+),score=35.95 TRINITY_DN15678_c0_g2_i1:38-691(+)